LTLTIRWILPALLMGSMCSAAWSQETGERRVLLVGFQSADGRFVTGIKTQQLRVAGNPKVSLLGVDDGPRRVTLLVDGSGSMRASWGYVLAFCHEFLSLLRREDLVEVDVFADKFETLLSYTSDFPLVERRLMLVPPPSSKEAKLQRGIVTRIAPALEAILASRRDSSPGDVILLISDGDANEGRTTERLEKSLIAAGVRVFFARVPTSSVFDRDPGYWAKPETYAARARRREVTLNAAQAERLAINTGGAIVDPWMAQFTLTGNIAQALGPDTAPQAAAQAWATILHVYRIELEFSARLKRSMPLSIDLLDTNGRKLQNVAALHPRHLLAEP
jgi:hypothetical protein